jgi:hypothetical protein
VSLNQETGFGHFPPRGIESYLFGRQNTGSGRKLLRTDTTYVGEMKLLKSWKLRKKMGVSHLNIHGHYVDVALIEYLHGGQRLASQTLVVV